MPELIILESHPVQYRVPVYQELERLKPGSFEVLFATDCSARGYADPGFGLQVKWSQPMLQGYPHRVLNSVRGRPLNGFRSLHGHGIGRELRTRRPRQVLFTSFAYEYDWSAWLACRNLGADIWLRQETQDAAFPRGRAKNWLRGCLYRAVYQRVNHAFYIGELNRQHLQRHGMREERLSRCPYCVVDPVGGLTIADKARLRAEQRQKLGFSTNDLVVAFAGKFTGRKKPLLLCEAVRLVRHEPTHRNRVKLLFLGSGELDSEMRQYCADGQVPAVFAGFVNQDALAPYYLAADILVLPSHLGETWGLVVNEALHAGCAVAMSSHVGCAAEFGGWERCRVFPTGDAIQLARAIRELAVFPRSFDWAARLMEPYSVRAAAEALAAKLG